MTSHVRSAYQPGWVEKLIAILLALIGLPMAGGGAMLIWFGGSAYYLLGGAALLLNAVLAWRGDRRLLPAYALFLAFTIGWAIWESGSNGWALAPRIGLPLALGLLIGGVWAARRFGKRMVGGVTVALLLCGVTLVIANRERTETATAAVELSGGSPAMQPWSRFGGDDFGRKHSGAAQITTANVGGLARAWTFRIGEVNLVGKAGLQATPVQVGNALYICSSFNDIIALDGDTGSEIWRYHARTERKGVLSAGCRGVAFYKAPGASGPCAERIITNSVDARLIAVDRLTGRPCEDFGKGGVVSLLKGMGQKYPGYYYTTSPPTIVRGRIILGGWVTDNQYWEEPSGVIRAFDARTGAFAWAMDIGRPDDHGEPAPGKTYTLSTPNSWGPMSADEELGLVYAPIGNPTPDYYGKQRRPFDEKIGSSIAAIDVETGALRWAFQTVHHDLWDYDVPAQPVLLDLPVEGKLRKALVQSTKRGELFLLDRVTGSPIAPVEERPVPQGGTAPGEWLSPTQPFSSLPSLRGADLSEKAMWGLTPLDQLWCRIKFRQARYEGIFTPPGLKPSVTYPGYLGGTNWGGLTVDPRTMRLVINVSHVANYTRIVPRAEADAAGVKAFAPGVEGTFGYLPQERTPFAAKTGPFLSPLGVPCNQPPYGEIVSIDLRSRDIGWIRPFGTAQDSGPLDIPTRLPLTIGTPNTGGPISTAGGLTFIGATQDSAIRAYETASGRMLWRAPLPAGGQATPMTFVSPKSGRQFVVIAAGGNRWLGSKLGDYVVAFALPRHR
ncbi:membrane-bound PQQ-dependent dehydrogenase, glucose/quinate/shikimate family [Rhizorhabdus histidinilytica]|uniref:Quinoprotein glucose dehydrogenase n=1 Tax=Rhizorhabdus histidinilytica TaxID=439228 RepID=A0A1T5FQ01_9SPHN|nr:membrane-bound PQQ-dependent dehydrogenase, glucose/quinate/shikimate family [Rhizorhabdus histidinilytica]SKB98192.1 quinoprotein glucose dehydrogenase [Rhizorhabdus histidinilytica]